jgi:hypothetical protein
VNEQQKDERAMVVVDAESSRAPVSADSVHEVGVIRPVASAEEVLAAWQQFQDVKRSLLTLDDYQEIQGRARIKKSGWRKIAAAFGISDQILCEERREHGTPGQAGYYFVWEIRSRAVAPNGRYVDAVGSCASNERRFAHVDHDVRAVAHTRSKNRAVADLVGGGEVSAEEIEGEMADAARRAPEAAYGSSYERPSKPSAWRGEPGPDPAPAAPRPAAPRRDEAASESQLRNIRAHLQRTRTDEATVCARASVAALEELTYGAAADLLKELSRQPNAA